MEQKKLDNVTNELKWIHLHEREETSFLEKLKSKGIIGFLVPVGCLVTAGILVGGIYQMNQKNRKMQQVLMRYRVAAQGFTIVVAMISLFAVSPLQSKSE